MTEPPNGSRPEWCLGLGAVRASVHKNRHEWPERSDVALEPCFECGTFFESLHGKRVGPELRKDFLGLLIDEPLQLDAAYRVLEQKQERIDQRTVHIENGLHLGRQRRRFSCVEGEGGFQ